MNAQRQQKYLELMALAASGDAQAQRAVVERLSPRVYTVARAVLGNTTDAEDAAQAILIEILASAAGFRGENLLAWVDRIAVRKAMRELKQRRVRAARCEVDIDVDDLGNESASIFPNRALARPLIEYLSELSETRRIAFVLRHIMGYSVQEVAELTEVSINTVKDRLFHARAQLRSSIRRDRVQTSGKSRSQR